IWPTLITSRLMVSGCSRWSAGAIWKASSPSTGTAVTALSQEGRRRRRHHVEVSREIEPAPFSSGQRRDDAGRVLLLGEQYNSHPECPESCSFYPALRWCSPLVRHARRYTVPSEMTRNCQGSVYIALGR